MMDVQNVLVSSSYSSADEMLTEMIRENKLVTAGKTLLPLFLPHTTQTEFAESD